MIKIIIGLLLVLSGTWASNPSSAFGQEDPGKIIEQKRQELTEKERRLKSEEERIKNIEKEVEGKIQKLNQLLIQIEGALKKLAEVRSEKLDHLVKTFEAMPPEEAAIRLSALDKPLAVQIIFRMTSKKAGPILALMEPQKVAEITEAVSKTEKKIPTK
ncbi:MAG: hypothetical protein HY787_09070 [Deltaproteobacteria bacterium]|nr:hypothetical protein [Deltaproteobacteria bacterium]